MDRSPASVVDNPRASLGTASRQKGNRGSRDVDGELRETKGIAVHLSIDTIGGIEWIQKENSGQTWETVLKM
jgi:hypothetical protein